MNVKKMIALRIRRKLGYTLREMRNGRFESWCRQYM